MQEPKIGSGDHYDLIVIGAGQGGGPLAGAFARAGQRVALVERMHVGGTCVNEGCSPTKTVIASARMAHLARRAGEYGVALGDHSTTTAGDWRVDLRRVHERKQHIVDTFRSGSERALADAGVELIRGQARFVGDRVLAVLASGGPREAADTRTLTAERVVINTGLRVAVPPLAGLEAVPYLTSTSILELTERPEHLVVLGGGYVGLEFAQAFRRFGSRVTVVQRDAQLLPREDSDVADAVADILREEGIDVLLSAEAVRVERDSHGSDGVRLVWRSCEAGTEQAVDGSHLLTATGRMPNTDDLQLDRVGIATDARGYVRVNERLETSAPGVYAIGDVNGGPAFTHISYDDFRILRTNLLEGGGATTAGRLVPYTVFIDPQLGAVGLTEREARASGRHVRVAKLPMTSVARALEVDETRGLMKAVVDAETRQILGATVLGLEGGEIATLFQLAMMGKLPYTALRDGVFSHPTLAEALNNLFTAMDRDGGDAG
ncbi:MAG: mercuric reductase [Gemmatimonadaceae bacterium]|nr:mercuric reductase [Geodermatophilaceae bacterium]MBA3670616.1 mercuric reductase [Gemmatimonadaceae bacterium]